MRKTWVRFVLQAVSMAVLSSCAALSALVLSGTALDIAHTGILWVLCPACAAVTAAYIALSGCPGILSWPVAPVMMPLCYWPIVGLPPSAGACLICAMLAILGAATGETLYTRNSEKEKRKR